MPNDPILGLQLQPVTVDVDGVTHHMHYGATEPEYVGAFPMRTDLVVLPELNPAALSDTHITNLAPPDGGNYGGHALQVTGPAEEGQVLVANTWGSDWRRPSDFNPIPQTLEANPNGGILQLNGALSDNDIVFYSKDRVEALRLSGDGDFIVQGRLVKRDLDVYNAFRVFLGMSTAMPPEPGSRDGIPTRYERILKKPTEDQ